jgi:hypothetical protein
MLMSRVRVQAAVVSKQKQMQSRQAAPTKETSLMTTRFSVVRVTDMMIHIIDAQHGGLVCAQVFFKHECDGSGWRVAPRTQRHMSRKLHATPEDAIASMKYLSKRAARIALASRPVMAAPTA